MEGHDLAVIGLTGTAFLLITVRVWRLRLAGVRVIVLGRGKRGAQFLVEALVLPAAALFLLETALHACHAPWHVLSGEGYAAWFEMPALRTAGVATMALAVAVLWLALRAFGRSYRLGVDDERPGELVTSGIFAYSRHPVYLGLGLFFLGSFLIYPNAFFFWMFLGAAGTLEFMARKEEQQLTLRHGEAYRAYARQVPKYLGWRRKPAEDQAGVP